MCQSPEVLTKCWVDRGSYATINTSSLTAERVKSDRSDANGVARSASEEETETLATKVAFSRGFFLCLYCACMFLCVFSNLLPPLPPVFRAFSLRHTSPSPGFSVCLLCACMFLGVF